MARNRNRTPAPVKKAAASPRVRPPRKPAPAPAADTPAAPVRRSDDLEAAAAARDVLLREVSTLNSSGLLELAKLTAKLERAEG